MASDEPACPDYYVQLLRAAPDAQRHRPVGPAQLFAQVGQARAVDGAAPEGKNLVALPQSRLGGRSAGQDARDLEDAERGAFAREPQPAHVELERVGEVFQGFEVDAFARVVEDDFEAAQDGRPDVARDALRAEGAGRGEGRDGPLDGEAADAQALGAGDGEGEIAADAVRVSRERHRHRVPEFVLLGEGGEHRELHARTGVDDEVAFERRAAGELHLRAHVRVIVAEGERQRLAAPGVAVGGRLVRRDLPRLVVNLDDVAPEEVHAEDAVDGAAGRVLQLREGNRGDAHVFEHGAAHVERQPRDARAPYDPARAAQRAG